MTSTIFSPTPIPVSVALAGSVAPVGTTRSPAFVHFDGTNFLKRSAGTGTGDDLLHNQAAFTMAVVFDPELILVGQSGVVIAKDNGSSQRAWRVTWDSTTGLVTVTVFATANGANNSTRTTAVAIRTRSVLVWTWDSTNLHLYVNRASSEGSQTDTGTPGAIATSTEPLSIGADHPSGGGSNPLKGAVYSIIVFNTALSSTDAVKLGSNGSIDPALISSVQLWWKPESITSTGINTNYNTWTETNFALTLTAANTSGSNVPQIIPSNPLAPVLRRNDWSVNFADTGFRPQNLTSTYVLSSTVPLRRLYNIANTIPNIAAGSNWRRFKNDITFIFSGFKPTGTNNVVVCRMYGFELLYDRPSKTLFANLGVDATSTLQNVQYTFAIGTLSQFGENQAVTCAVRYNSSSDTMDCWVGNTKYAGTTTTTNSFSNLTSLTVSDQLDYIRAVAIPACVPDATLENLFLTVNGTAYPDEEGQYWRYTPQGFADGLATAPNFPDYAPSDPDVPPAIVPPSPVDMVVFDALLLPSIIYSDEAGPYFRYVDDPYPVQQNENLNQTTVVGPPIFGDPLPSIISVTADIAHNCIAIASAGPTDAGQVITWWEVEYADGNTQTFVQIDYNGNNNFATHRNETDLFSIPLGLDYRQKRIRFVIQAVADGTQIWKSLYLRLPNTAPFNNNPPQTIVIPGPNTPSPPTASDLEITLTGKKLILAKQSAALNQIIQIAENSRYKLTKPFLDPDRARGVEFELMTVLDDFYRSGSKFRIHRVRDIDIGFLDRLAVAFYGPGNESLWWVIAYANAIRDPEFDMSVGQSLVVPSKDAVQTFLARRPTR